MDWVGVPVAPRIQLLVCNLFKTYSAHGLIACDRFCNNSSFCTDSEGEDLRVIIFSPTLNHSKSVNKTYTALYLAILLPEFQKKMKKQRMEPSLHPLVQVFDSSCINYIVM